MFYSWLRGICKIISDLSTKDNNNYDFNILAML
jgi:hypothetical protein